LRRGLEKWTARATNSFAAHQHRGVGGRHAGDLFHDLVDGRALADNLALHTQPLAQLQVFVADLRQVLRQFLAAAQVL